MYGLFRVDHVIGMYRTYYRTNDNLHAGFSPSDEEAQIRLGETLLKIMGNYGQVIAEDLGVVPDFLRPSMARLRLPGYRVLRWERFDTWHDGRREIHVHAPMTWPEVSVATSGTHDTDAQADWWDSISPDERRAFIAIPAMQGIDPNQGFDQRVRDGLLQALYSARSELALLPFQDLLGSRERVNLPGTVNNGNWTYRMAMDLDDLRADRDTGERLAKLAIDNQRGLVLTR
jgi:4-alpha-glucanotransferase